MARKKSTVVKSQRGHSETAVSGHTVGNIEDLPQADTPVDPFESTMAPSRDGRGETRDWTGENGSGRG